MCPLEYKVQESGTVFRQRLALWPDEWKKELGSIRIRTLSCASFQIRTQGYMIALLKQKLSGGRNGGKEETEGPKQGFHVWNTTRPRHVLQGVAGG